MVDGRNWYQWARRISLVVIEHRYLLLQMHFLHANFIEWYELEKQPFVSPNRRQEIFRCEMHLKYPMESGFIAIALKNAYDLGWKCSACSHFKQKTRSFWAYKTYCRSFDPRWMHFPQSFHTWGENWRLQRRIGQKKYLGRYATRNKGINDVWVAYFSRYVHVPLLENIIDIWKFRFGRHTGEIIIIINCTYLF